jgi:hypothetical protein
MLGSTCRIHYVHQAKCLKELTANKIQNVDLVLFSENIFTTNKKTKTAFFASIAATTDQQHQALWTTWWRLLLVDEAHSYADGTKIETHPNGTCDLTRKAVTIKSLLAAQYTLLITATPNLQDIGSLNTYAYLMGATGYPLPRNLHDLARSAGAGKLLQTHRVPEETKTKIRNLLLQNHVVSTGAKLSIETREVVYHFVESSLVQHNSWSVIYMLAEINRADSTDSFIDQCRAGLVNRFPNNPDIQARLSQYVDMDRDSQDRLGRIVPSENDHVDKMNAYRVPARLAPVHAGLVRLIAWLIDDQSAKILIYDGSSTEDKNTFWKHPKAVLKQDHNIDLFHFGGPMAHLNRKRKLLMDESRTALFLPNNHIDGTNFPFVTHVIVVGEIMNESKYLQFIGRGTRQGRSTQLQIVKIQPTTSQI